VPTRRTSSAGEQWAMAAAIDGKQADRLHAPQIGTCGRWSLPPLQPLQFAFLMHGVTASDETSDHDQREQDTDQASATGMGLGSSCSTSPLRTVRLQRNHSRIIAA
jgi:hypothetical protein